MKLHKHELESSIYLRKPIPLLQKDFPPSLWLCLSALHLWCKLILEHQYLQLLLLNEEIPHQIWCIARKFQKNSQKLPSERWTWNTGQKPLITDWNLKRSSTQGTWVGIVIIPLITGTCPGGKHNDLKVKDSCLSSCWFIQTHRNKWAV